MNPWMLLTLAVCFEVLASSSLKESQGMKNWAATLIAFGGYGVSFYLLALVLKQIPLGIAYAIWSGAGIIALSLIGLLVYQQALSWIHLLGIGLIIAGVVLLKIG